MAKSCDCRDVRRCHHDGLEYPYPKAMSDRLDRCLTFGATAIIELLPSGNLVKKSPHPFLCSSERHRQVSQLMREVLIYKRLQAHRRLIKMISYSWSADEIDGYVIFEYMRVGSLEAYLASDAVITQSQQLDWCLQAIEGIAFLHSSGVIHGDIKPENMVLDDNMCVRIIDFSRSSIDDFPPLCLESTRYFLPRPKPTCNVQTDIFALGSSLYHIMQRAPPFEELDIDEIEERYKRQDFPKLTNVFCRSIIAACWRQQIESANATLALLQAHRQRSIFVSSSGRLHGVLRSLYQGWAGILRRFRSGFLWGLGRLV